MEAQSMALSCDDSYISLLVNASDHDHDHEALMSDDKYAEELQLQETIMVSLISDLLQKQPPNISENSTTSIEIQQSSSNHPQKNLKKCGESSQTLCEICAERKDHDQIFLESCTHGFCTECITKHISITINKRKNNYENPPTMITCPTGCVLEIDACREIVGKEVVTMWDELITESMIPSSQRFYCPYKNCSALLVNDGDRTVVMREAECPFCRRLFCVRCCVPWHAGVSCDEFSKMSENERGREDLMVHELAKKNKWQRCPRCKFFVEKNEGCLHMTCRCGFQFCYACGAAWSSTHGGCQRP